MPSALLREYGQEGLNQQAGHAVEHPDARAENHAVQQDRTRILDDLRRGGLYDFLQLASHLAEPAAPILLGDVLFLSHDEIPFLASLLGLRVDRVLSAEGAVLLHLQTVRVVLLVLDRVVVSLLALVAAQGDLYAHS